MPGSVTPAESKTYERPLTARSSTDSTSNENTAQDADLRQVIEAWPELSEAFRTAILAIVRAQG